jgi:hypothetical protein
MDHEYCIADFLNDSTLRGLMVGHDTATQRMCLAVDARIPCEAQGYVAQLCSESASRSVQLDAARMLSRYVPFYGGIPAE